MSDVERPRAWSQPGRDITSPGPCYLRMRLVHKGPYVGARIFLSLGMLTAEVNGAPADVDHVWTSGEIVTEDRFMVLMTNPHPAPWHPVHISAAGMAEAIEEQIERDWWHRRPIT